MFYKIIRGLLRPILFLLYRPKTIGLDNFPKTGKVVLYSNHISMLDPILIACMLPRRIYFMAKSELFQNPILRFVLKNVGAFPVKRGTADLAAIKNSLKVLKGGNVFGIFPEGTRGKQGEVKHFSLGAASIAHRSKAKVIPVGVIGRYKLFHPMEVVVGEVLDMDNYFSQKSNTELMELISTEMENSLKSLFNKQG
ncbi:MAG TPA: lysophospholipid acyltransferase family protein [Clostridia bacterium]|nr:lysophospholipid acyltransferase family protein [Clostridia bacterium]